MKQSELFTETIDHLTSEAQPSQNETVQLISPINVSDTTNTLTTYKNIKHTCICILWCICAIVMTILNKKVLEYLPVSSAVLLVQIFSCVVLLKIYDRTSVINFDTFKDLLPCAILFCINLFTSMEAVSKLSIPTFNVIRNMQCFISCPLAYAIRNEHVSWNAFFSMVLVLFGSAVYCWHHFRIDTLGFIWAVVNTTGVCVYAIVIKTKFTTTTPTEMAWYNNTASLLPISLVAMYDYFVHQDSRQSFEKCFESTQCSMYLALSSVGCFVITITTFHSQQIMSPVTWLLLNNLNKIPSTVISCFLWNIQLGWLEVAGLVISLAGGMIYSFTKL
jgi:drug/metabolite transporter (DMT)-like permease